MRWLAIGMRTVALTAISVPACFHLHLMRVDHLAHRIQQVLHVLHAVLQREEPTRSLRKAASKAKSSAR